MAATTEEMIVLVDEHGNPTGTAEKYSSHHAETPLHLAFSCYVFDETGAFLATRRALTKEVWPGVWSNSVCGHPAPGEASPTRSSGACVTSLAWTYATSRSCFPTTSIARRRFGGSSSTSSARCSSPARRADRSPTRWRWGRARGWTGTSSSTALRRTPTTQYSWWCKNQLRELVGHPVLERYVRSAAESHG